LHTLPDFERGVSIETATERIESISRALSSQRGINLVERNEENAFVALNRSGEQITFGLGKGAHARVGAFGECLEHLHILQTAEDVSSHETLALKAQITEEDVVVRTGLKYKSDDKPISSIEFRSVGDERVTLLPTALVNVFYCRNLERSSRAEKFFSRYASSSGTAFGFSADDALLHAILEIIERHEISRLFMSLINLEETGRKYALFSDYSFNDEVRAYADLIKSRPGVSSVASVLLMTEFDAFFCFTVASLTHNSKLLKVWGAGSSLSRDLAIYRSVTECLQMMTGSFEHFFEEMIPFSENYPILRRIRDVDLEWLPTQVTELPPITSEGLNTELQLRRLTASILSTGRRVYQYQHQTLSPDYVVTTAYVTDVEKFYGVAQSVPVLPIEYLRRELERSAT